jgi:excisionase family DNA binding protein
MRDTLDSPSADSSTNPVSIDDKLLVSRREAATQLSISQRALDYLIANRTLSTKRIGTRVLIPTRDLRRFARADHPERLATRAR